MSLLNSASALQLDEESETPFTKILCANRGQSCMIILSMPG